MNPANVYDTQPRGPGLYRHLCAILLIWSARSARSGHMNHHEAKHDEQAIW